MNRIVMLMSLGTALCYASCTSEKHVKEESGKYTVTTPLKIDTSFAKEYVSQIKSMRNIDIRAQEKGYLQNIYVDEGKFVKRGQLLFRIMLKFMKQNF